ncbi:unnamed protein product, partial [marine sediment metagenome]
NCEACREAVIAQEHATADSVAVIPNGVDLTRFRDLPQEPAELTGRYGRRVGVVANLRDVKGLDLFIRAAAMLASRHEGLEFLIAGEGELRSSLESLINELGVHHRVKLVGEVVDVPAFLHGLDIAVLSSR